MYLGSLFGGPCISNAYILFELGPRTSPLNSLSEKVTIYRSSAQTSDIYLSSLYTVGARKRDTLRNKVKQKLFFHSFIIFFLQLYI